MKAELTESIWLNGVEVCRIETLAQVSGLSLQELDDLIDVGVIEPVEPGETPARFMLAHLVTATTARRLRDDFQLDRHGLALALTLLRRIERLEQQISRAQARF